MQHHVLVIHLKKDCVHTCRCAYWTEECVELCLCGCSHSQKPLMVIHHQEDCQFSKGMVPRLFSIPAAKISKAEIQVHTSPAGSPTQSWAWFYRGTLKVCSLPPVKGKLVGYPLVTQLVVWRQETHQCYHSTWTRKTTYGNGGGGGCDKFWLFGY